MKKALKIFRCIYVCGFCSSCPAQKELAIEKNSGELSWKQVASKMPDDWYGSHESKRVADSVLTYQTGIDGWSKNHDYVKGFDQEEWAKIKSSGIGSTFDNGSTLTEMIFLTENVPQSKG